MAKRITRYHNSIILLSSKKVYNNIFVYECIERPINLNNLLNSILEISKYKKETKYFINIKNKIIIELKKLNYNLSHIGTKYLIEVIFEIYIKKDYLGDNLKNNIYSILAKRYNKSNNTIYGDIKQATISMYANCKEEIIEKYFDFEKCRKPKVSEVIFKVLNKIEKI